MSNLLPKYYVTFGVMYSEEEHPYFPNAHPDGWVEIESPSENEARIEAYNLFNDKWAFIYNENNFDPTKYPAGRIATVKEIKDFDTENLLYYKVKSDSSNTIVIVSETEHKNTLSFLASYQLFLEPISSKRELIIVWKLFCMAYLEIMMKFSTLLILKRKF